MLTCLTVAEEELEDLLGGDGVAGLIVMFTLIVTFLSNEGILSLGCT